MRASLYAKLAGTLALLMIAIGGIYSVVNWSVSRHHLERVTQTFNRDLAHKLVADRSLVREGQIDQSALKEMFDYYMNINPSIEIYLLDAEGKILSFSADPGKVVRNRVALAPILEFVDGAQRYPLLGDDPRSFKRSKAFSVTPVPSTEDVRGYLYVVLRGEAFDSVDQALRDSYLLRLSTWSVAISLVAGLIVGLFIFWLLTRRVRRLASSMEQFRTSDSTNEFSSDWPTSVTGVDELDDLHHTFELMARRIVEQINALRTKDNDRREMIAHVSHDLRTPLASLTGYLETLKIKADSLSQEQRREYLDVALGHGRRLAKLIDELFELAKLEAVETRPELEPFSVGDLLQDVLQKFKLRANEKRIHMTADIPGELPLAYGDIGLIERVLENLIINALDHTPMDGEIHIGTDRRDGEIVVAISDNGKGIPEDELDKVFERFYRAGRSTRSDQHAGLGLAIAQQILKLHDSSVIVDSKLNHGTTFSFALSAWSH